MRAFPTCVVGGFRAGRSDPNPQNPQRPRVAAGPKVRPSRSARISRDPQPTASRATAERFERRTLLSATFSDPISLPIGGVVAFPRDLNGDATPDLVVPDTEAQAVRVFLGRGAGRFAAPIVTPAANINGFLTLGDFNGDRRPDLAFATINHEITLMTGDGRGAFAAAASFPAGGNNPVHPVAADFNNDGHLDLATSGWFSGNVRVQTGDGAGRLSQATVYPIPFNTLGLVAADFNGDGSVDLAVSNWANATMSVLTNDGSGNFTAAAYPIGGDSTSLAVADFNRDGRPDVAAGIGSLGGQEDAVSIMLNSGAGFSAPRILPGPRRAGFAVADFDADGTPDIVVRAPGGREVTVLLGDGTGAFADGPTITAGDSQVSIAAADYDGDGRPDVALGNHPNLNLTLLLNTTPTSNTLTIEGTDGNDRIEVIPGPGSTAVRVTVNGAQREVSTIGITRIQVNGLAGRDRISVVNGVKLPATLDGGAGDDRLLGGGGNDTLLGGPGNDTLDGRGGADLFRGGAGTDTADYTARRNSVFVGIGTAADDGERNEGDNVFTDMENVWGGRGDDVLRGSSGNNRLTGGDGNDQLHGRGGRDVLIGGDGNDLLFSRDTDADTLDGGTGDDRADADRRDLLSAIEGVL